VSYNDVACATALFARRWSKVPDPSPNQTECDQWHQVKQNYADLENRKPPVMNRIKGLNRELKPTAMRSVHPVVGEDKGAEPDE
jgi:hypothetical protein